jgi:hypothetical protein
LGTAALSGDPSAADTSSSHLRPGSGFQWAQRDQHSPFELSGVATPYRTARMSSSIGGSLNSTPLGSLQRQSFEDKLNRFIDHDETFTDDPEKENRDSGISEDQTFKGRDEEQEAQNATAIAQSLDEVLSIIYDEKIKNTVGISNKAAAIFVICLLIITLGCSVSLSCFPLFTCTSSDGICLPQVSIQLTDSVPASKSALATVRELFKVLSYLAMDFGDAKGEIDTLNTQFEDYYKNHVIDTFNEDTIYRLNFWGYCRMSPSDSEYFCMKSYGFDLLGVFVRDAGVQFAELTGTNVGIMGESFAITYELAVSGFNQLISHNDDEEETVTMLDYAILLQKFSKGMACLTGMQFLFNSTLLACAFSLLVIMFVNRNCYTSKKYTVIGMTVLSFITIFTGFLICSLTYQYVLKIADLAQNAGIAMVAIDSGYKMIWINCGIEALSCCIVVYLANIFRKKLM